MHSKLHKSALLTLVWASCFTSGIALAEDNASQNSGEATNAIAFAIQAGQIAGTAQACGINITTFTTRAGEAINKLALNPTDSEAATNSFQQTLQQAQTAQNNYHRLTCSQVNQDFSNLPLLRPDYEQTVIAQLNPGMTGNNSNNSNPPNNVNSNAMNNNQSNPSNAQAGMATNNKALTNTPNQQSTQANQTGQANNAATNTNKQTTTSNNPAYPQQNYGPMKSFNNTFPGAVQPYGMANTSQNQATQSNNAPAQNNTSQPNNPPPPSFSNPNNAPAPSASGNYPNQ